MTAFRSMERTPANGTNHQNFNRALFLKLHAKQKDESLATIAESYFGASNLWPMVWSDNPMIDNPTSITSGTPILIRRADRISISDRAEAVRVAGVWELNPTQREAMVTQRRRDIAARR